MSFTSGTRARDLYLSAFAQFFGALGTFLVMVTLVLALQRRGAGGIEVAALVLAEALPMVLLGKLIGAVVDRFDSRWLLILAGFAQVAACLVLSGVDSFAAVVAGAIGLSVATGIAQPTRQALLPAIVHRDDLPRASAIGQTAGSLGMMLGPALAGFAVSGLGPQQTVRLAGIGFLATVLAGLAIRTRRGGAARLARTSTVDGPWTLASDRLLRSSTWSIAAVIAAVGAVNVVLVFFIMRTLAGSEATYGVVDSMWTIGLLAGAWIYGRLIRPTTGDLTLGRWLLAALGLVSAAVVLVGFAPRAWWIIPCYLVGGAANGGLNVLMGTLLGRRTPAEARGRANAAMAMRIQAGAMLGYVAGGALLEFAEPRTIVIGCGLLGILTALAAARILRPTPATPATPATAAAQPATPALHR
jgi:MFS family permease